VRVATYNVHHGRPWRGFTTNEWLVHSIARLDADILAVQEVERRVVRSYFADQPTLIAEAAGAQGRAYAPARRLALTGSDGVALLVRGSMLDHQVMRFKGREGRQNRVAIVARVHVADRILSVVATHLQSHADDAKDQLDQLLGAMAPLPRPRILLGDLNLEPSDVAGRCAAAGLTLAGGRWSAPAFRPTQRLDHIAVDGIALGEVEVRRLPVSDHRAVVAELR
jgi:endonuclease/exonuclease/phosphatase family metal-dependent hydrolase